MNYGKIGISTNPSGATVYVSSQKKGLTPIDIVNVNPGIYNITLSYPGLDSYNFDTVVIDGKMTSIDFNFILQEVTEKYIELTGTDLVQIQPPFGLPEEKPPGLPPNSSRDLVDLGTILDSLNDIKSLLGQLLQNSNKQNLTNKFDTGLQTLTVAVTTVPAPENVSVTGYTRVAIWDVLGRLSQEIYLINNGPGTIYVRKSNDGTTFSAVEIPVFAGEKGTFNNLYELRIRSDIVGVTGTIYRVTEHESNLVINNFDDRAATAQHITWTSSPLDFNGPQPFTAGLTYTVPTGYKAKISGAGVFIRINTGAAVPGQKEIAIILTNPTIGDLFLLTRTIDATHNAVGFVGENSLGFAYTLLTGESLSINYYDTSVIGNVHYAGSIEITQYFSYPT